ELKQALATMRTLEEDFLATAGRAAEATNARSRPALPRILDTARETGTETGRIAAHNMTELAQRFSIASLDAALAGMEVAAEGGTRFAHGACGIRPGLGDIVRRTGVSTALERAGQILQWGASAETMQLEAPERVRLALQELGPTFIKPGQVLGTRHDLCP